MKPLIKTLAIFLVCANTAVFLLLAYLHLLSTEGRALVFVDFWGRLCIYSFWIIGYAAYRRYLDKEPVLKYAVIFLVCANIPLFLLLAYLEKVSNDPQNLVFVDFWGRLTVYSLWFMLYEAYRNYMGNPGWEESTSVASR
jgi:hypothetical protein